MNFEQLNSYLLSKQGATYDYPFDEEVRVYRIANKMFALTNESKKPLSVIPIYSLELCSLYDGFKGGYHMNKKHWNTLDLNRNNRKTVVMTKVQATFL